jgi:bifunctional DNA-binding transcriptional regulator/antitoxin component of YhaV-PrlF toxin-antitoxin module
MVSLSRVLFGTARIQKLRRIALDQNLLTTLGLKEGDVVAIELDVKSRTIMIRRAEATTATRKIETRGTRA